MVKIFREFVSEESRDFRFKLGKWLASGLSGFIFGVIVASLFWYIGIYFYKLQFMNL